MTYYYFRFCPSSWKCTKYRSLHSYLVILPFSVSNVQKMSHLWSLYLCIAGVQCWYSRETSHVDVASEPATNKTGSRYNDIRICVGKPKGSVTMSQKQLSHCLLCHFRQKPHWGSFHPPLPIYGLRRVKLQPTGLHCISINCVHSAQEQIKCVRLQAKRDVLLLVSSIV